MKISVKELRTLVREAVKSQLTEAVGDSDQDKELHSFLEKADKVLADCRESLMKLSEEGEALAAKDLEKKDRNAMVLSVVGVAKKLHGVCMQGAEHLKKSIG
jgi:hypothetical protein